jgi:protein-disulfide isomerase-like protein with CxxC motif
LHVTHFSDPGCPWAYSASPALAVLRFRFGGQLVWDLRMIGLTEDAGQYAARGYTPLRSAVGQRAFHRFGMPFSGDLKERVSATSPACRLVVAARLDGADELAVFRALQFVQFTTPLPLEDARAHERALELAGAPAALAGRIDDEDVRAAYEADRAAARTAAGTPTEAMGRAAQTDGAVRYTAPSLVLRADDGRTLDAGGFLPLEAYDVCLANLDPGLERRAPAASAQEALEGVGHPLTTREVAAVMTARLDALDDADAEAALLEALHDGAVTRTPLGGSALWALA